MSKHKIHECINRRSLITYWIKTAFIIDKSSCFNNLAYLKPDGYDVGEV